MQHSWGGAGAAASLLHALQDWKVARTQLCSGQLPYSVSLRVMNVNSTPSRAATKYPLAVKSLRGCLLHCMLEVNFKHIEEAISTGAVLLLHCCSCVPQPWTPSPG